MGQHRDEEIPRRGAGGGQQGSQHVLRVARQERALAVRDGAEGAPGVDRDGARGLHGLAEGGGAVALGGGDARPRDARPGDGGVLRAEGLRLDRDRRVDLGRRRVEPSALRQEPPVLQSRLAELRVALAQRSHLRGQRLLEELRRALAVAAVGLEAR